MLGLEFSIFSSLTLADADARAIRSTPRRRSEKVAPTPAAIAVEFVMVVVSKERVTEWRIINMYGKRKKRRSWRGKAGMSQSTEIDGLGKT